MNCICIFIFLTVTHIAQSALYWKTGEWSPCVTREHTCSLSGYKTRNVTCSGSSGNTLPDQMCQHQLGSASKPETRNSSGCVPDRCIIANKHRLRYVVSEWSPCTPVNDKDKDDVEFSNNNDNNGSEILKNENTKCAPNTALINFLKTRQKECRFYLHDNNNGITDNDSTTNIKYIVIESKQCKKFMGVENVIERQWCYKKCTASCALTLWTKWARCTHCRSPIKYKNRGHASLNAQTADTSCSKLSMLRVKLTKQATKSLNQYRVTGWRQVSVLYHKENQFSRFSVYQRNVSCVHRRIGSTCKAPGLDLVASHKVKVGDRDCVYTMWSSWSSCHRRSSQDNHAIQSRHRRIFSYPLGFGSIPCNMSRLFEQKPCTIKTVSSTKNNANSNGKHIGTSSDFSWFAGSWSECRDHQQLMLPTTTSLHRDVGNHKCIVYKRRRQVFCTSYVTVKTNENGDSVNSGSIPKPVEPLFCAPDTKPEEEQICGKPTCTQSGCAYLEWGKWDKECRHNQRMRRRQSTSQSCPESVQARTCDDSQPQWVKDENAKCQPLGGSTCGEGRLDVVCKKNDVIVDDFLCDSVIRDTFEVSCKVPCTLSSPNQCQYSSWTLWTECKTALSNKTRFRTLMYGNGGSCKGPVTESMKCFDSFYWVPSSWGTCQLQNTSETCGNGTQTRDYLCVEERSGLIVNDTECVRNGSSINNKTLAMTKPIELVPCYTCASETSCVLTPWSEWEQDCSAICSPLESADLPTTSRRRYIVTYGNACSTEKLIETKECPACLDYYWVVKNWDVCTHDRAPTMEQSDAFLDMRNGFQIRNVFCSDGTLVVADTMCPGPKPIESRDCHIDWLDTCNLKPWSSWNECDKFCGKGMMKFCFFYVFFYYYNKQRILE